MKNKYYLFKLNTNILNILSIAIMVILFLITNIFVSDFMIKIFESKTCILVLALLVPYLCLHEILHSISYVIHGAKFKTITYGANIEKGVLCCLCKQNINKKNILFSLMYPFTFIGVVTYIIGIIINSNVLIGLSIMNMAGCSGDLIMFFNLIKLKDFEYSEYDDPISFGLYTKNDWTNKKMFGLQYVETLDKLKREDYKKIRISKTSIITFILLFLMIIIYLLIL